MFEGYIFPSAVLFVSKGDVDSMVCQYSTKMPKTKWYYIASSTFYAVIVYSDDIGFLRRSKYLKTRKERAVLTSKANSALSTTGFTELLVFSYVSIFSLSSGSLSWPAISRASMAISN